MYINGDINTKNTDKIIMNDIKKSRNEILENARKSIGIKNLETQFIHNGLLYEQIKFDKVYKIFTYHVNKHHFEVFYTSQNKLPKDNDFGISAYCCKNIKEAERCESILKSRLDLKDKVLSKY